MAGATGDARRVQERGLMTRSALLDAAVECLIEDGYAATTTIEVAKRAGVSRGAHLHHFPTKAELLTAAVGHLFERRMADFRKVVANAESGVGRLDTAIDLLWSMFKGPTFAAWVELWLAARTDAELRSAVVALDRRFKEETQAIFVELFPPQEGVDPRFYELGRSFAFTLMDGLALQRLVPHDEYVPAEQIIDSLKLITRLFVPTADDKEKP